MCAIWEFTVMPFCERKAVAKKTLTLKGGHYDLLMNLLSCGTCVNVTHRLLRTTLTVG